jgi:hypothetical protein
LIFYRLSGDCVERRAEIGVVGRGGLDGLIGEQVGARARLAVSCSAAAMRNLPGASMMQRCRSLVKAAL